MSSVLAVERFSFERLKSSDFNTPANDSLPSPHTRYLDAGQKLLYGHLQITYHGRERTQHGRRRKRKRH